MSLNQSLISDFSEYYRWSQRTIIKYKLQYGWCTGKLKNWYLTWISKWLLQSRDWLESGDWLETFLCFRFYDQVNTIKAMSSRSVKLLGRLRRPINVNGRQVQSTHTFASNWQQLPFLLQGKVEWLYVVEIISWSISTKVKWPSLGSDSRRLDLQLDVPMTALQSPAKMGD